MTPSLRHASSALWCSRCLWCSRVRPRGPRRRALRQRARLQGARSTAKARTRASSTSRPRGAASGSIPRGARRRSVARREADGAPSAIYATVEIDRRPPRSRCLAVARPNRSITRSTTACGSHLVAMTQPPAGRLAPRVAGRREARGPRRAGRWTQGAAPVAARSRVTRARRDRICAAGSTGRARLGGRFAREQPRRPRPPRPEAARLSARREVDGRRPRGPRSPGGSRSLRARERGTILAAGRRAAIRGRQSFGACRFGHARWGMSPDLSRRSG